MGLLSNIISFLSIAAGITNSQTSALLWTEEPVCPRELL